MHIAMKEARETHYWLRLIRESALIADIQTESLLQDCKELVAILSSITLTTRRNMALKKLGVSSDIQNSTFHLAHSSLERR
jgi:hypothetical protein